MPLARIVESHSRLPRKTNRLLSGFREVSATTHSRLAIEKSTALKKGLIFPKRNEGPFLFMVDLVPRSSIRSPANKSLVDVPLFEHLKKGIRNKHKHMRKNQIGMILLFLLI